MDQSPEEVEPLLGTQRAAQDDAYVCGRNDERKIASRIVQDLLAAYTETKINEEGRRYRATVLARDYLDGNAGVWP